MPFIFQLLVLLTQDTTCRSVTLPKVLQLCDSVMASGQVADKFSEWKCAKCFRS